MPQISFDTPWKHQKTRGFLMISGAIKRDQWHEIGRWDCRGLFRTLSYIHDGFFLQKWWAINYFLKKAVECLMFDRVLHSRHLLVLNTFSVYQSSVFRNVFKKSSRRLEKREILTTWKTLFLIRIKEVIIKIQHKWFRDWDLFNTST